MCIGQATAHFFYNGKARTSMAVNIANYKKIQAQLEPKQVTLIAVSKIKSREEIMELYNLGQRDFGENYVQELILLYFTGIAWIDSVVALIFAVIILVTGYRIVRTSIAGIMDEADIDLLKKMVQTLNEHRTVNWIDLHNLRIIRYGPTIHLDCHLTVPWYFNVHEAHQEIDELSGLVRKEYGDSVELFVHSDGCMEFSCPICDKFECKVRQHAFTKKIEWTMENISTNHKHSINS